MKEHNNYLVVIEKNLPYEWSEAVIIIENDYLNINNLFYDSDDYEVNVFNGSMKELSSYFDTIENVSVYIVKLTCREKNKEDLVITYYLNFYDDDETTIVNTGKLFDIMAYMESNNLYCSEIKTIIKFSEGFLKFLKKSLKTRMNEIVVEQNGW